MRQARYQDSNNQMLRDAGLNGGLSWGEITEIRVYGDIGVVEHNWLAISNMSDERRRELAYSVYLDGVEIGVSGSSWDHALLVALGYKHDGLNSRFAEYAGRMLGMESE